MNATEPSQPARAIGYVRVSTAGQAEHGMSLDAQRERIVEYATAKGYELLEVAAETASGAVQDGEEVSWEHRPVLSSLVDRAAEGAFDVLLVARLDRLSRDYVSLVLLERRLQKAGATVVSVAEENGDGALAEFVRGQLGLVAQLERAMILERVSVGKAKKRAAGLYVGGRVPFGYQAGKDGTLEVVPEQAEIVRCIFDAARAGQAPNRIARELNDDGIPSPRAGRQRSKKGGPVTGKWTRQGVLRILRNRTYLGELHGIAKAHAAIVTVRAWNAANTARQ